MSMDWNSDPGLLNIPSDLVMSLNSLQHVVTVLVSPGKAAWCWRLGSRHCPQDNPGQTLCSASKPQVMAEGLSFSHLGRFEHFLQECLETKFLRPWSRFLMKWKTNLPGEKSWVFHFNDYRGSWTAKNRTVSCVRRATVSVKGQRDTFSPWKCLASMFKEILKSKKSQVMGILCHAHSGDLLERKWRGKQLFAAVVCFQS